jgi:hypothetical protein
MRIYLNHARRLVIGGASAGILLAGAVLSPASAADRDAGPDPKVADAGRWSLPVDVTGDAAASAERDRIRAALKPVLASDGGMLWDAATKTLTIQMTSSAALQQARGLVSAAAVAPSFRIEYAQVQYAADELEALSAKLLGDQAAWAGATGIGGGFDPKTNRVLLQVDPKYKDADTLIAAIKKLNDPRVTLQILESVGDGLESRVADSAPWKTGAAIDSPLPDGRVRICTLGWTWRMWTTNEVVGSTARHCAQLPWYNNGNYVGTVFKSAKAADSALMRGTSYSPSVFVGNTTTNDIRPVVGIDTSWNYGDPVAMSGRTTGLTVSTVAIPSYTLPSCAGDYAGVDGVLMETHPTAGGDSGGPWLTTQSGTGYAIAHGQHFGYGCAAGYGGSFFLRLNTIASAQGASLLVQTP